MELTEQELRDYYMLKGRIEAVKSMCRVEKYISKEMILAALGIELPVESES